MPTFATFRRSTYLTLAAAFLALGYAEWELVPEATVLMGLMVLVLGGLYVLEERMPLSLPASNRVGAVVGVVGLAWLVVQVFRPTSPALAQLPWSVRILPYIGPVLAVLLPVKLMRPQKHVGDYWAFHAAALCLVALSAAMADDFAYLLLVTLYIVLFAWSLALFFLMRASGQVAPIPSRGQPVEAATPVVFHVRPGTRSAFRPFVMVLLAAAVLALPPFLLTPRSDGPAWDLSGRRIEVGYAAAQMLDLNRTGTLRVNREVAFEVNITDLAHGTPVEAFNPEQRWRGVGATYTTYRAGAWRRDEPSMDRFAFRRRMFGLASAPMDWSPPSQGPGTVRLDFLVPNQLRSLFLADPVQWNRAAMPPLASLDVDGFVPWAIGSDGDILAIPPTRIRRYTSRYSQSLQPRANAERGPLVEAPWVMAAAENPAAAFGFALSQNPPHRLTNNPVPGVSAFADELVGQLIARGTLPPQVLSDPDPATQRPRRHYHAAIAAAFRDELRQSGTFTYTLKLKRKDSRLDPIEDFLRNTRSGHCERFATALVLLLRAQGIPAQFVLGFMGCESQGGGKHVVRQEHAHAWAEALVPAEGEANQPLYQWLSLDATPGGGDTESLDQEPWLDRMFSDGKSLMQNYVLGYDASARQTVVAIVRRHLKWSHVAVAAVSLLLIGGGWRYRRGWSRRGRPSAPPAVADWYQELLAILAPAGFQPQPGQTPCEFAAEVEAALRSNPATADVAGIPRAWTDAHYAARFGHRPISAGDLTDLEDRLARLRQAVTPGG